MTFAQFFLTALALWLGITVTRNLITEMGLPEFLTNLGALALAAWAVVWYITGEPF